MKNMVLTGLLCVFLLGMGFQAFGQANPNMPSWVREVPPADVKWGIGYGKLINIPNSMNYAEFCARMDLARQILAQIRGMITDYSGTSNQPDKLDDFDYECLAQEFSFEFGNDVRVVRRSVEPDGSNWCRVELNRAGHAKYYDLGLKMIQKYSSN